MTNVDGAGPPVLGHASIPLAGPQAAAPAEHVVARMRRHGRMLFWPSLLVIGVAGGVGFLVGTLPEEWQNIAVLIAAAVLALLGFVIPLLAWLNLRYTITSRRLIVRRGFFVRVRHELLHSRGYEVSVRRSWVQSAFRTGDILVSTGSERPVVLRDVPNADLVQEALHDLIEANQATLAARRGVDPGLPSDHTVAWGER